MIVKNFTLPSFEDWTKKSCSYNEKIGAYYCSVCVWGGCPEGLIYVLAVADCKIPSNAYATQIVYKTFICDENTADGEKKLKEWYDSLQPELNEKWKAFVTQTYFVDRKDDIDDIP